MKLMLTFFLVVQFFLMSSQTVQEMVLVESGTFKMGSDEGYDDESPVHTVKLTYSYYISKYEITVSQYREFCTATGRSFPGLPTKDWYNEHEEVTEWKWVDNHPIVNVTWNDAVEYCKWLSKETGDNYSLPTEAEWEFAARGGNKTKNYKYSGSNNLNEVAWYDETTYERGTRQVGQLKANELGIYDMNGNACEWCSDAYQSYSSSTQTDPVVSNATASFRVIRGGCWFFVEENNRLTFRDGPKPFTNKHYYGFRVVKK